MTTRRPPTVALLLFVLLAFAIGTRPAHAAHAPTTQPASPADVLAGVARILFLGDSITYAGQYVDEVETELRLRLPGRRVDVINCGLPSETVSGLSEAGHAGGKFPRPDLHERLDRVLAKAKPDLVFACYGMNDGIYLPQSPERLAAFKAGMTKLHEKVEAAGAKVVHLTPAAFDAVPIKAKVVPADKVDADHPFEGYDGVLTDYTNWLIEQRKAGWRVVDVHGAMVAATAERRKADPAFTFSRDGVHPNAEGHHVMATAVLNDLGLAVPAAGDPFGRAADPASVRGKVLKLVRQRGRILTDAWLTDTGHKRPMNAGLPMAQAIEKAAAVEKAIGEAMK